MHSSDVSRAPILILVLLALQSCGESVEETQGSSMAPRVDKTPLEPVTVFRGEEALIDCVAENLGNYTLLWRRADKDKSDVIAAGQLRVSSDPRVSVMHLANHNTWVLKIQSVEESDAGHYVCEINTNPPQQVYRLLQVVSSSDTTTAFPLHHNYTECCIQHSVPSTCHSFCSLKGIMATDNPPTKQCMEHLPVVTQCLTDGRDHRPCCEQQNIPEVCSSVCMGDYKLSTVLHHYTCMGYTIPVLACIAQGIEVLPGRPREVTVEPISSTELNITWLPPSQNVPVKQYRINVTQLHVFDTLGNLRTPEFGDEFDNNGTENLVMVYDVNATSTHFMVQGLLPISMYQIQMVSMNDHGSSLPTYAIRTLTLSPDSEIDEDLPVNKTLPKLPDIKACCIEKGVEHERCLENLCNPVKADEASLTDVMICAPWANLTFQCLASGVDHSACCISRGVPSDCLDFCRGTVQRVDYRHFACLEFMSSYSNCLLDHYGVLPGPPQDFTISSIHNNWVMLRWSPPKKLPESVVSYILHYRVVTAEDVSEYYPIPHVVSPLLLDNLTSGIRYEAFIVAQNKYGISEPSVRVVFATPQRNTEKEVLETRQYNETVCCNSAGLSQQCAPLCNYQMKLADVVSLGSSCVGELSILARCGAGGRNHVPCCRRRDVSNTCLSLCAGLVDDVPHLLASQCVNDMGKILQCMKEGVNILPGVPTDLHAILVTPTSLRLEWNPPNDEGAEVNLYQVQYTETTKDVAPHPLNYQKVMNVTSPQATVTDLKPDTYYSIYVMARNRYGTSLPSLVLLIHTPINENQTDKVHSVISPPQALEVLIQGTDSLSIKWLPPLHAPADASIKYTVYYQPANSTNSIEETQTKIETALNAALLSNLTYNTQYEVAVRAIAGNAQSALSEVVLVWTDEAVPPAVQLPVIIPAGPIMEGANITVMCMGSGIPMPTISLFLNGHLLARRQHHSVAVGIYNVHRNITSVSCFAVNGLGQGAHSSVDIRVRFSPNVRAITPFYTAPEGGLARLQCQVSGSPEPKVTWKKNSNKGEMISVGPNVDITTIQHEEKAATLISTLMIQKSDDDDAGEYVCQAENQYGLDATSMNLVVKELPIRNTSACCKEQGVIPECLSACTFDIDIDAAINKPKCIQELDKLMFCAADGSDHRKCCRRRGVPHGCLKWCAGHSLGNQYCVLHGVKEIITCFQQGRAILPGPPKNVEAEPMSESTIKVQWTKPDKNPELVQWYRVLWRPVGSRFLFKNQTQALSMELHNLEPGKTYEVVVKAGNYHGLSLYTDPAIVSLQGSGITASATQGSSSVKIAVGVVVGFLLLLLVGAGAAYYYFYHYTNKSKTPNGGVSFENPTYMKDGVTLRPQRNGVTEGTVKINNVPNGHSNI